MRRRRLSREATGQVGRQDRDGHLVADDGRFLMIRDTRPNADDVFRQITVELDWFPELEAQMTAN